MFRLRAIYIPLEVYLFPDSGPLIFRLRWNYILFEYYLLSAQQTFCSAEAAFVFYPMGMYFPFIFHLKEWCFPSKLRVALRRPAISGEDSVIA